MRQPLEKACVWAVLALFGCISLFGSGWHHFVGHAYHGAACHTAHQHNDHHGVCHHHGPTGVAHAAHATLDNRSGQQDGWSSGADHDCPLCKFFAQAQWVADELPGELTVAIGQLARPTEPTLSLDAVGLYRSRAPPLGRLSS